MTPLNRSVVYYKTPKLYIATNFGNWIHSTISVITAIDMQLCKWLRQLSLVGPFNWSFKYVIISSTLLVLFQKQSQFLMMTKLSLPGLTVFCLLTSWPRLNWLWSPAWAKINSPDVHWSFNWRGLSYQESFSTLRVLATAVPMHTSTHYLKNFLNLGNML